MSVVKVPSEIVDRAHTPLLLMVQTISWSSCEDLSMLWQLENSPSLVRDRTQEVVTGKSCRAFLELHRAQQFCAVLPLNLWPLLGDNTVYLDSML